MLKKKYFPTISILQSPLSLEWSDLPSKETAASMPLAVSHAGDRVLLHLHLLDSLVSYKADFKCLLWEASPDCPYLLGLSPSLDHHVYTYVCLWLSPRGMPVRQELFHLVLFLYPKALHWVFSYSGHLVNGKRSRRWPQPVGGLCDRFRKGHGNTEWAGLAALCSLSLKEVATLIWSEWHQNTRVCMTLKSYCFLN